MTMTEWNSSYLLMCVVAAGFDDDDGVEHCYLLMCVVLQ